MRSLALLCLLIVALAGCGAGAARDSAQEFDGEEQKVAAVVEALETAARKADSDKVCKDLLADSRLAVLKEQGVTCKTAIKQQLKLVDAFDVTVDDVAIDGDRATATVVAGTGSGEKTERLELVKSGSAWKIDALRG